MATATLGEVVQTTTANAPNIGAKVLIVGGLSFIGIILIGLVIFIMWNRKRFNLQVNIKLPRNDGNIINSEQGKGFYDPKRGVVKIKRPGYKISEPMQIFDIKRYIEGTNTLTVIQVAPGQYIPVVNTSYLQVEVEVDDETKPLKDNDGNSIVDAKGNPVYEKKIIKEAIMNIKADPGINKAWKTNWTTHAKRAFSIQGFLDRHQTAISIGIVFILCFVGFSILYSKVA